MFNLENTQLNDMIKEVIAGDFETFVLESNKEILFQKKGFFTKKTTEFLDIESLNRIVEDSMPVELRDSYKEKSSLTYLYQSEDFKDYSFKVSLCRNKENTFVTFRTLKLQTA